MSADPEDLVEKQLTEAGIEVSEYQLYGTSDNPIPGDGEKCFCKNSVKIVYRLKNPETLIIVLYEVLQKTRGMKNPFYEFLWFIDFLKTKDTGVKRVEGMAKVYPGKHASVLPAHRLVQFYKKWINVKVAERTPGGGEWIYGYLDDARPLNYRKDLNNPED